MYDEFLCGNAIIFLLVMPSFGHLRHLECSLIESFLACIESNANVSVSKVKLSINFPLKKFTGNTAHLSHHELQYPYLE